MHPTEPTVLGHKAYQSVSDLPQPPDPAVLIVPTDQVVTLLEDFGRIGTKRAIVITAGFKETGPEGKLAEEQLKQIAETYGMRFLGPNCMGIINTQLSLNLTIARLDPRQGSLGLASQSGTYVTQVLAYLRKRGIRFSKAISVGNEANIDIVDVMEYLAEDEHTKAIILYIEGIRNGRRFIESAQRITPNKPIVAQYVGGSKSGARAGLSHTGAMAGPDVLYEGIFRQAGIIRIHSVEALYAHGWALATQPPLHGKRLGIVTNSGGPGTAISHIADTGGLEVPPFSAELQEKIRPLIPSHASSANPIDLTFHLDTQLLSTTIPEIVMQSGEVDGLVIHGAISTGVMKEIYPQVKTTWNDISEEQFLALFKKDLAETVSLPWKYDKPVMISSFFDRDDYYTEAYMEADIPVFDSPEKAAGAMVSLLRYKEIRERKIIERPAMPRPINATDMIIKAALQKRKRALDEYESKRILSAYGLPVARGTLAITEGEAVYAATNMGFPVAVKASFLGSDAQDGQRAHCLEYTDGRRCTQSLSFHPEGFKRKYAYSGPGDGERKSGICRWDVPLSQLRSLCAFRPWGDLHGGGSGYRLSIGAAQRGRGGRNDLRYPRQGAPGEPEGDASGGHILPDQYPPGHQSYCHVACGYCRN